MGGEFQCLVDISRGALTPKRYLYSPIGFGCMGTVVLLPTKPGIVKLLQTNPSSCSNCYFELNFYSAFLVGVIGRRDGRRPEADELGTRTGKNESTEEEGGKVDALPRG